MYFDFDACRFQDLESDHDAWAVIAHDRRLTWQQLESQARAWCEHAQALGLRADAPIVIRGHKEAAFMVALTGALMLRAPFVPVDAVYPQSRLQSIIDTLDANLLYDTATGSFHVLREGPPPTLAESGLCYIMFTSGTTGQPKGVQIGRESTTCLEHSPWVAAS